MISKNLQRLFSQGTLTGVVQKLSQAVLYVACILIHREIKKSDKYFKSD
jgi:hypothetical protein